MRRQLTRSCAASFGKTADVHEQWRGQLFARGLSGKTEVVEASSDDTVGDVKARIKCHDLRLVFGGRELSDEESTLGTYGVGNESTVAVLGRLAGGMGCASSTRAAVVAPAASVGEGGGREVASLHGTGQAQQQSAHAEKPADVALDVKLLFEKHGLADICGRVCDELGVKTVSDLNTAETEDIEALTWLTPIQRRKLISIRNEAALGGASTEGEVEREGARKKKRERESEGAYTHTHTYTHIHTHSAIPTASVMPTVCVGVWLWVCVCGCVMMYVYIDDLPPSTNRSSSMMGVVTMYGCVCACVCLPEGE